MSNERWTSPFPHTIAYTLFKKHFTEINRVYWAFVPANNTIQKFAKEKAKINQDPKSFFLIHDEDDRRVASTYDEWKYDYSEYSNYTRMNIVMLLSSCLETYLRTIISLAFESKPGVIIHCPDSVDGFELLKKNPAYGNNNDNHYQFTDAINDICVGEWTKRISNFEYYFGTLPETITNKTSDLDEFRVLRNNIAHYFGREKRDYEAPLVFEAKPATRVSHERIIKFFRLVHEVASNIDCFLKENYIGAYDIIKFFFKNYSNGHIPISEHGSKAIAMKNFFAEYKYYTPKSNYFEELANYCEFPDFPSSKIYGKQVAIQKINQILRESKNRISKRIGKKEFNKYLVDFKCKSDNSLCIPNLSSDNTNEFLFTEKLIKEIASYFINLFKKVDCDYKKHKTKRSL